DSVDDIFLPGGRLRHDLFTETALTALQESLRLTRETRWDTVRSPHVFMGLLAVPDPSVCNWGERLQAALPRRLSQYQELFPQEACMTLPKLRHRLPRWLPWAGVGAAALSAGLWLASPYLFPKGHAAEPQDRTAKAEDKAPQPRPQAEEPKEKLPIAQVILYS